MYRHERCERGELLSSRLPTISRMCGQESVTLVSERFLSTNVQLRTFLCLLSLFSLGHFEGDFSVTFRIEHDYISVVLKARTIRRSTEQQYFRSMKLSYVQWGRHLITRKTLLGSTNFSIWYLLLLYMQKLKGAIRATLRPSETFKAKHTFNQ